MGGGGSQPLHACFEILGNALPEAIDLSKLIIRIGIALLRSQFKHRDGFLDVRFQILLAYSVDSIHTATNGGFM